MLQRNVWVGVVALGLAAAEGGRVGAQTRAAAQPRVAVSRRPSGSSSNPGGTLRVWGMDPERRWKRPSPRTIAWGSVTTSR